MTDTSITELAAEAEDAVTMWRSTQSTDRANAAAAEMSKYIEGMAKALLALSAERDKLRGAISWIEPPFVDANTPEPELRKRIGFVVADAKKALSESAK